MDKMKLRSAAVLTGFVGLLGTGFYLDTDILPTGIVDILRTMYPLLLITAIVMFVMSYAIKDEPKED